LHFPRRKKIKGQGVLLMKVVSTGLGLKGIPNLAEELQIARNLFLLEYTGGNCTFNCFHCKISSINQRSKSKRIAGGCSAAVHH
jgi:dihydroorotase